MTEFTAMRCRHGDVELEGRIARPSAATGHRLPAVLVMHNALGIGSHVLDAAARLAEAGYLAVVTDMYGADADVGSEAAAGAHFASLAENPAALRARARAWFDAVAARDDVDPGRIAAIGYCFGGQCVLELARSGADVKAVVSYHGLLTTHALAQPGAISGEVAVFTGERDPYAPADHVEALRQELKAAGARYQITLFGEAEHSFTDRDAARTGRPGIAYHALSDAVSWAGTLALLHATVGAGG